MKVGCPLICLDKGVGHHNWRQLCLETSVHNCGDIANCQAAKLIFLAGRPVKDLFGSTYVLLSDCVTILEERLFHIVVNIQCAECNGIHSFP